MSTSDQKIGVLISQMELQKIAEHRREITWHSSQLKPLEKDVLDLLIAGATVEPGRYRANVSYMRRHNAAWKDVVIRELGEDFAHRIYKSSPIISIPRLQVVEHPPLPLFLDLNER